MEKMTTTQALRYAIAIVVGSAPTESGFDALEVLYRLLFAAEQKEADEG